MSASRRRRAALVGKGGGEVAKAKEGAGQGRGSARPQAVAQVAEQRDGQVHAQLGDDADNVDLELGVVQAVLEQRGVERVGRDAAGAEAVDNGPDEAQPAHRGALQALAVAVHDALSDLLEEAAGVAVVVAAGRVARDVGASEQRTARAVVVEFVDAQVGAAAAFGRGRGRHTGGTGTGTGRGRGRPRCGCRVCDVRLGLAGDGLDYSAITGCGD